jgi:hypothetical protein
MSVQPPEQNPIDDVSWGCALWFFGISVGLLLLVVTITEVLSDDDYDSGDDCNDSYIEEDYNGDGEEDAEDFRIQIEGC